MDLTGVVDAVRSFIQLAAIVLEASAAVIILVAAARAAAQYLGAAFSRSESREPRPSAGTSIRIGFGRSLLLALEFTVGSTILKVAITPTLQDISVVAVAVGVRVVLALVLQSELAKAQGEGEGPKKGPG